MRGREGTGEWTASCEPSGAEQLTKDDRLICTGAADSIAPPELWALQLGFGQQSEVSRRG